MERFSKQLCKAEVDDRGRKRGRVTKMEKTDI
jgi:hypothetical protein